MGIADAAAAPDRRHSGTAIRNQHDHTAADINVGKHRPGPREHSSSTHHIIFFAQLSASPQQQQSRGTRLPPQRTVAGSNCW